MYICSCCVLRHDYAVILGVQLFHNLAGINIWHFIPSVRFYSETIIFGFQNFQVFCCFNSALIQGVLRLFLCGGGGALVPMSVSGLGIRQRYVLTLSAKRSGCLPLLASKERGQ